MQETFKKMFRQEENDTSEKMYMHKAVKNTGSGNYMGKLDI